MPELPEIETVKLQLQKVLIGKKIVSVSVRVRKSFQGDEKLIIGKKVLGIRRKAKLLLINLQDDITVAIHFKMTGQLVYQPECKSERVEEYKNRIVGGHPTGDFTGELPSKHTRVIFYLDSGTLYFNDQRMFGWVRVDSTFNIDHLPFIRNLGPEPFDINKNKFLKILSKLKKPIKLALMDQTIISGVGNIYANDALWEAKIDPRVVCCKLSVVSLKKLHQALIKVLSEGIKYGGATAADDKYINLHGLGGHYQDHFRVYDREGEECRRPACRQAGGIIHKYTLGGRGTYFCPKCQK